MEPLNEGHFKTSPVESLSSSQTLCYRKGIVSIVGRFLFLGGSFIGGSAVTTRTAVDDLLRNVSSLLDSLLDGSDDLLKEWCTGSLVRAICEATEQTR